MKKYTRLKSTVKCPRKGCGKDFFSKEHEPDCIPQGDYEGNGGELGYHIIDEVYYCKDKKRTFYLHPFYYTESLEKAYKKGKNDPSIPNERRSGIAAHHLICSATVKKTPYRKKNLFFAYSVNHHKNGILLPTRMKIACHFKAPLHRGSHDAAYILKEDEISNDIKKGKDLDFPLFNVDQELVEMTYADKVSSQIADIMSKINLSNACNPEDRKKEAEKLINEMDKESQNIWMKIKHFRWSVSADGFDYHPAGIGCYGKNTLPDKRDKLKKITKIKADSVASFTSQIYGANLNKLSKLKPCKRTHYTNHLATWKEYTERKDRFLKEKKF